MHYSDAEPRRANHIRLEKHSFCSRLPCYVFNWKVQVTQFVVHSCTHDDMPLLLLTRSFAAQKQQVPQLQNGRYGC